MSTQESMHNYMLEKELHMYIELTNTMMELKLR